MKPNPWHSETLTTAAAAEKVLKGSVIEEAPQNLFPIRQFVIYAFSPHLVFFRCLVSNRPR